MFAVFQTITTIKLHCTGNPSTMNDRGAVDADETSARADENNRSEGAAHSVEESEPSDSDGGKRDIMMPIGPDGSGEESRDGVLSSDAREQHLPSNQGTNGDAAGVASVEEREGGEEAMAGRERLMQRLWQRAAGMRSDLVVTFGDNVNVKTQYDLHKFPLYSKVRGLLSPT